MTTPPADAAGPSPGAAPADAGTPPAAGPSPGAAPADAGAPPAAGPSPGVAPVVVAIGSPALHAEARTELDLPDVVVVVAADAAEAADRVPAGAPVVRVVLLDPPDTDAALAELDSHPALTGTRAVLVTRTDDIRHVVAAIDSNRLTGVLTWPWTPGALRREVRGQVGAWLRHSPRATSTDAALHAPPEPRSTLTRDLDLTEEEAAARLLAGVERVLGHRPRLLLPAGTHLTREGRVVQRVFLVLRGRVRLERGSRAGRVIMHHASTGPIIGLLSMRDGTRAAVDSVTTEESEVVMLTIDQLDRVLGEDRDVVTVVAALMTRAFSRRLRRSEELQVELTELNHELHEERTRLAETLAALDRARVELVAQARMAMLGDLAAGIGHELNNPVAALTRAAEHLATDLDAVLATHPEAHLVRARLEWARTRTHRSAAEDRALRRAIAAEVGDAALARRLLAAGVATPAEGASLAARGPGAVGLAERAAGVGTALRSIDLAAGQIAALVASFRSYSRPERDTVEPVDVADSISAALSLTAHRMVGVRTDVHLAAVPRVLAHPGRLEQVWTNLLVNAADAVAGSGAITVELSAVTGGDGGGQDRAEGATIGGTTGAAGAVRVVVTDTGAGIAPENLERIFTPRFTTKDGTVRFGLGLGLALVRQIVTESGGTIRAESVPGRTRMIVELPAHTAAPADDAPETSADVPSAGKETT